KLDAETRDRCAGSMRGGNWGPGAYPSSGGLPAGVLVTAHYGPRAPDAATRSRYPRLTNLDVLEAKNRIRDEANERLSEDARWNPVHSSDNEAEAWAYVSLAMPHRRELLRQALAERREEFRTPGEVMAVLRCGRRAKV